MQRLTSLDILRGIALAGMILVNNPGDWGNIFAPLEHAEFIGLTPTDLVFPTFLYVMSLCIPLSLKKYDYKPSKEAFTKILRRTVTIFAIGLFLQWMSSGWCAWHDLRIPGVLQRLALCYGVCASLTLLFKQNTLRAISIIILISYVFLLTLTNSYELSETNIIARVDHFILGANHLYTDNGVKLDPEGFLSTVPAIAHVLLVEMIMFDFMKMKEESNKNLSVESSNQTKIFIKQIITTIIFTFIITFFDILETDPISKKIWTTSFVLVTYCIDTLLFLFLIWIVDVKKITGWISKFFIIFGRNPLLLYIISWILADWFGHWGVTWNIYHWLCLYFTPCMSSLLYAISFVLINWLIAFGLYKAKVKISA